ncbi:hypothetical protein HYY74_05570 [Candidatus Woesearchaeota archaeon]|nr:hypothetical protein [Candidatus Woesearchaeota archaeon]
MRYKNLALLLLLLLGGSLIFGFWIEVESSRNEGLDKPVTLSPGGNFKAAEFLIEFVGVVEDSRCPKNVMCVWEGQAVTQIKVIDVEGRTSVEQNLTLRAGHPGMASATVGLLNITLLSVEPYPGSEVEIKASEYRATFRASK